MLYLPAEPTEVTPPAGWRNFENAQLRPSLLRRSWPRHQSAAPAVASEEPPQARVWLTTVDQSQLLAEQSPVAFGSNASSHPTIVIDPESTYQTMDGFGASITDSSAAVLSALSPAERDATMRKLFDPAAGIGVSFLRQPMGSSDFTAADEHYTYDDVPLGETDFGMEKFSIGHDEAQILPLLRQAKELNPALKVVATPWSPPAWIKPATPSNGGSLKAGQPYADAYATYLTRFVSAYTDAGVPIDYLTIQNRTPVPEAGRLPGHRHARRRRGQGDFGPRANAQA